MMPLTWQELRVANNLENKLENDLLKILQHGTIPSIYFSSEAALDLQDYCGESLKEEVQAEGLVRNLHAFTKLLEKAAFSNSELVSYSNIARDCGVNAKTVAEYYQILEDTFLGYFIDPYTNTKKTQSSGKPKILFFRLWHNKHLAR
jgi:uncharacterized protein